jgi:surfeit locus 1 family protein
MTALSVPILLGLGKWQLDRKAWKEGLIAAIEERLVAKPVDVGSAFTATYAPPHDAVGYEYIRVRAKGRFHHDKERYYYAPDQQMGPGFHVYTPFEMSPNGTILFVNRGYVPEHLKDPAKRSQGQVDGEVEVTGLLRSPGVQETFTPDNDVAGNLWFWRDYYGMLRSAFENTERPQMPVFVDAEGEAPGGWPKGGATLVKLPNRHLEYAITWFGLAAVLLAVFATYAAGRLRGKNN